MLERKQYYQEIKEKEQKEETESERPEWVIFDSFINYAMEASYYIYAQMLSETVGNEGENSNKDYFAVLNEYDWDSDYHRVKNNVDFVATYEIDEATQKRHIVRNAEEFDETVGKLVIQYDAYGNLSTISFEGDAYVEGVSIENEAKSSMTQYLENAEYYAQVYEKNLEDVKFVPKNLTVEFYLDEESSFVDYYDDYYYEHDWYDYKMLPELLWLEVGAIWIIVLLVIFVIMASWILPLIPKLNTGREKLFSMPLEVVFIVGVCVIAAGVGMSFAMAYTTPWQLKELMEHSNRPEILGYEINAKTLYNILLVVEFLGWSLTFFFVYVVSASMRQFFLHPILYIKNQTITFKILRKIKGIYIKLKNYVLDIDLNDKFEKSVLKIVAVNFVIVSVLCCLWFGGVLGTIIYSILVYYLLKKYGEKVRKQYQSVLHATKQMAEGDLKISLDEDLGIFKPIGDSLEEVQVGFQKAVIEEAKSQNMKTELITNVSHDLKTPLTSIITYVDLLKNENLTDEERKSYIATLEQKSQRLKVLIEDLFEVSKAHSGNVKMNFMNVDVVSLLKQVRSELNEEIEDSALYFRWNLPEEKVILSLDGQRTYRIFENLIHNILKYAMPYSRVYIDVVSTESQVQIRFRNVSAIELEVEAEHLTDRFVRGDSARNSEGSGLGLAIAKSFVELQHGKFKIEVDGDLFKVLITFNK